MWPVLPLQIQAYLAAQLAGAGEDTDAAQRALAEQCCIGAEEFAAAVRAAVAAKELPQAEVGWGVSPGGA